jgi:hypothetical protein
MSTDVWHEDWTELDFVNQLGPVILRCRTRLRKDAWRALGGSALTVHTTPFFGALFLTMPLIGIAMYHQVTPPLMIHPIWGPILGTWYAGCVAMIYRYYFTSPRGPSLVLHENGFRYGRKAVSFSDLSSISIGQLGSRAINVLIGLNRAAGRFSVQNRAAAQLAQASVEASALLEFKDGQRWPMKNILIIYLQNDINRFFDAIRSRYPELLSARDPDRV